jgi:hypothetical protein
MYDMFQFGNFLNKGNGQLLNTIEKINSSIKNKSGYV